MALKPGDLLVQRYEYVRMLGQGAMGEVLHVRDRHSGLEYALKRILPEKLGNPAYMEHARRNFQLVSRLSHPNIATTRQLEVDAATGELLILMDLVRGGTLFDWVQRQRMARGGPNAPLPMELVLPIAFQIADALDYAHDLPVGVDSQGHATGMLHRDLKPANVMLEERPNGAPQVRIVDFGLAAEIQTSLTGLSILPNQRDERNRMMGTLLYMAPEQFSGASLTRGVDQWALAVIVYEMLAGFRPFDGQSVEDLAARVQNPNPARPPGISETQWHALRTAFNGDRRGRHRSCRQFIEAMISGAGAAVPVTLGPAQSPLPPTAPSPYPPATPTPYAPPTPQPPVFQTPMPGPSYAQPAPPRNYSSLIAVLAVLFIFVLVAGGVAGYYALRPDELTTAVQSADRRARLEDWEGVLEALDGPMADLPAYHPRREEALQLVRRASHELGMRFYTAGDYATALPYLRRSAEAGEPAARYFLSLLYRFGRGTAQDAAEGERWLALAADDRYPAALNDEGVRYETNKDLPRAREFYRQAAEGGHALGWYNYGRVLRDGKGGAADPAAALPWLIKAADDNNAWAQWYAGDLYAQGSGTPKDPVKAYDYIRRAADRNVPPAMERMGRLYENGQGVTKDLKLAREWFQKAADAGNADAQEDLKRLDRPPAFDLKSEHGRAAEKAFQNGLQYTKSQIWNSAYLEFNRAAQAGHPGAMLEIAYLYFYGRGREKNLSVAYAWALKAADAGHPEAQTLIGYMYGTGTGVALDWKTAVEWYRKAAENGSQIGMCNLAFMYRKGQGVTKDIDAALAWYDKAWKAGSSLAAFSYGEMYEFGEGVTLDLPKALEWYRTAAARNHAAAMTALGRCYANGTGVARDYATAMDWLRKGAALSDGWAMNALGYHYENGWGVPRDLNTAADWYDRAAKLGVEKGQENLNRVRELIRNGGGGK
ncbi:MAG: SEL1-like repeat protein [Planctomycetota bacterium]|nr:SEL1-like repeat protein [Planctomycetota bacterium]